jgi:hypothetical protein
MAFIMEENIAFNPINVTFFSFVRVMLQANDITDLFKELFRRFFPRAIFRIFLDSVTIWYVIQIVSGYQRRLYGMFLNNILYRRIIRTISAFCLIGVDYTENVGIINSLIDSPST